MMAATHGFEEYIEGIYVLTVEGQVVSSVHLAQYLGVSAVSVSRTLDRLERDGYVTERQPEIKLTPSGWSLAEDIVRRHRIAERWLSDTLGLDWVQAHKEAGKLEHAMSPEVEKRLWEEIGRPLTCPHGNPLPGYAPKITPAKPLSAFPGPKARIERIFEQLEGLEERLVFLQKHGLMPGALVEIVSREEGGACRLRVEGRGEEVALEPSVAEKILVVAPDAETLTGPVKS